MERLKEERERTGEGETIRGDVGGGATGGGGGK